MPTKTYSDRVRPLLSLGAPLPEGKQWRDPVAAWRDYAALGITENDAAELIAMATDKRLHRSPEPACFAPVHAWRALGQQRCQAAVRPLVDLLDFLDMDDDDWGLEEVPEVLAMIGPGALPELKRALPDQRRRLWARVAVSRAMTRIARDDPSQRGAVVQALSGQLRLARHNDPDFNGSLVANLMDLKAVEAAKTIASAYEAGDVNERVAGPLSTVLAELGVVADAIPLPASGPIDRRILDEVMREYNAKQKASGPSAKPMSRAEHEQAMRELGAMLRARLGPAADSDPDDSSARAQDLAYRAVDAGDAAESLALARQALDLDPDCVDALLLIAKRTLRDPDELIAACERAVQAGERSLGPAFFGANAGQFWGVLETRPYMRARARLANLLRDRGRTAEAAAHYEAMLELNEGDNLGLRYALAGCYLTLGKADAMKRLVGRFDEDSAFFLWPEVFMHVLGGDQAAASRALARARRENAHVEPLLTEIKPMPASRPGSYSPGGKEEAVFVAENILPALRDRPMLAAWIKNQQRSL